MSAKQQLEAETRAFVTSTLTNLHGKAPSKVVVREATGKIVKAIAPVVLRRTSGKRA